MVRLLMDSYIGDIKGMYGLGKLGQLKDIKGENYCIAELITWCGIGRNSVNVYTIKIALKMDLERKRTTCRCPKQCHSEMSFRVPKCALAYRSLALEVSYPHNAPCECSFPTHKLLESPCLHHVTFISLDSPVRGTAHLLLN